MAEIILPSIAQRLKPLRNSRHLTQEDMGKLLDCTSRHYQKIEYGQINVPSTTIIFLAKYFGVSADYLLGLEEEPYRCYDFIQERTCENNSV